MQTNPMNEHERLINYRSIFISRVNIAQVRLSFSQYLYAQVCRILTSCYHSVEPPVNPIIGLEQLKLSMMSCGVSFEGRGAAVVAPIRIN